MDRAKRLKVAGTLTVLASTIACASLGSMPDMVAAVISGPMVALFLVGLALFTVGRFAER